ncbi:MAG: trimethylamine methyltransferase family protein, partial [Eisenbergiella sp.]
VWGVDADGLKDQVEMADAIAGGHDKLVEKPFLALFPGCPITPLIIDSKIYKKLKYSAESGLPMIWMSGIQLGTTSPVTIAGAIASNMCEMLMGVILSQLINEGCTLAVWLC